nr:iron-sulfur cluster insertion protein ErpA [Kangiella taiwanensis]
MGDSMSITVTDAASKKVRQLIEEEENQELKLRVFVTGGGCSGFQYGFTFDENQKENDMTIEQDGVKILVDSLSFQYLMGSEVDYTEGLQGSRFIINNPQAKTTCGCGSSFSI